VKILLTGGSGYIGSRLCRRLVDDGHAVTLLLRAESSLGLLGEAASRVAVFRNAESWHGVRDAVTQSRPDLVFHLAARVLTSHEPEDVRRLVLSNVLFGAELLEAMSAIGVHHLVAAGTFWQHYQNADYDPVNLYAATKQAFEDLLTFWSNTTALRAIVLELFDVYGPNDPRPKLVPLLRRAALGGEEIRLTPGDQLIDIVHVDDVVGAFVQAGTLVRELAPGVRQTYAVSSGEPMRLRQFVHRVEEAMGRSIPVQWGGRPYRPREMMVPSSRGLPLPGWKPMVSLEEGIRGLVAPSPVK
jgi:nucleoside-diphosphate-sugar epimerase